MIAVACIASGQALAGVKRGFGDDDVGVLLKLREQPAGVEVRSPRGS